MTEQAKAAPLAFLPQPESIDTVERQEVTKQIPSGKLMWHIASGNFENDAFDRRPTNKAIEKVSEDSFKALKAQHDSLREKDSISREQKAKELLKTLGISEKELEKNLHRGDMLVWSSEQAERMENFLNEKSDKKDAIAALQKIGFSQITVDKHDKTLLQEGLYKITKDKPPEYGDFYKTFCLRDVQINKTLAARLTVEELYAIRPFLIDVLGGETAFNALKALRQTQDILNSNTSASDQLTVFTKEPVLKDAEDKVLSFFQEGLQLQSPSQPQVLYPQAELAEPISPNLPEKKEEKRTTPEEYLTAAGVNPQQITQETQRVPLYQEALHIVMEEDRFAQNRQQALKDINDMSNGYLHGLPILLIPSLKEDNIRMKFSISDIPEQRLALIEIYLNDPQLADEMVKRQIVGGHGTSSVSLLGALEHGLKPLDFFADSDAIRGIGEEYVGAKEWNRKNVSFDQWFEVSRLTAYALDTGMNGFSSDDFSHLLEYQQFRRPLTTTSLQQRIDLLEQRTQEILQDEENFGSQENRNEWARIIRQRNENLKKILNLLNKPHKTTEEELHAQLIQDNFPVIYLLGRDSLQEKRVSLVKSASPHEFGVENGTEPKDTKIIIVPESKVELVKRLVQEKGLMEISVYPLQSYMGQLTKASSLS